MNIDKICEQLTIDEKIRLLGGVGDWHTYDCNGKYLLGNKAGYETQADTADSGMTFYFKASDLGEYILFDQDSRYLTYNTFNAIVRNTTLSDRTRFKVEQYEDNSFSFYS